MLPVWLVAITAIQSTSIEVTVTADTPLGRISPYIYGLNGADFAGRHRHLKFGRSGGNRMTAYNWENNASNAGSDWFHQNDDYLGGGDIPDEVYRLSVQPAVERMKAYLVTIPMTDYVAADKNAGGDVNQTTNYLQVRFRQNRAKKGSAFAYPPNLGDAFVYQDEFVWWLENQFARRASPIFYSLDNEPDLWQYTHNRIHPDPVGYQELFDRTKTMSNAIKDVAPKAVVFGPVSYGFYGYVRLQGAPDHNNRDFLDWYLQQNRANQLATGRRAVDVLDLHWYPEAYGGGVRITGSETSNEVVQARIQAPRSLWDSTYRENSWIANDWYGGPIRLLGRLKQSIATNDPAMKLAFTEYYYGAGHHISGGIAQADVLGVFGREGVFAASAWVLQSDNAFMEGAFDIFTNFDGKGSGFGEIALPATSSNIAELTAYASRYQDDKPGTVHVLINKASSTRMVNLTVSGAKYRTIATYTLNASSANVRPSRLGSVAGNRAVLKLPPMSVNLVRLW